MAKTWGIASVSFCLSLYVKTWFENWRIHEIISPAQSVVSHEYLLVCWPGWLSSCCCDRF